MQIQKSAKHYTEAAQDEIKLLSEIRNGDGGQRRQHCVQLRDSFEHAGPHGRHVCMVFEVRLVACNFSRTPLAGWRQLA